MSTGTLSVQLLLEPRCLGPHRAQSQSSVTAEGLVGKVQSQKWVRFPVPSINKAEASGTSHSPSAGLHFPSFKRGMSKRENEPGHPEDLGYPCPAGQGVRLPNVLLPFSLHPFVHPSIHLIILSNGRGSAHITLSETHFLS